MRDSAREIISISFDCRLANRIKAMIFRYPAGTVPRGGSRDPWQLATCAGHLLPRRSSPTLPLRTIDGRGSKENSGRDTIRATRVYRYRGDTMGNGELGWADGAIKPRRYGW